MKNFKSKILIRPQPFENQFMNNYIHNHDKLLKACALLAKKDTELTKLLTIINYPHAPKVKRASTHLAVLVEIIINQQISTAAAMNIHRRFKQLVGAMTPENILQYDVTFLRQTGISTQKAVRLLELCKNLVSGNFSLEGLAQLSTEQVYKTIMLQKGYGPWSAGMYALFGLGRVDIFPSGDLALQIGYSSVCNMSEKLNEKQLSKIAEKWAPYRSAAALIIWEYYNNYFTKTLRQKFKKLKVA